MENSFPELRFFLAKRWKIVDFTCKEIFSFGTLLNFKFVIFQAFITLVLKFLFQVHLEM